MKVNGSGNILKAVASCSLESIEQDYFLSQHALIILKRIIVIFGVIVAVSRGAGARAALRLEHHGRHTHIPAQQRLERLLLFHYLGQSTYLLHLRLFTLPLLRECPYVPALAPVEGQSLLLSVFELPTRSRGLRQVNFRFLGLLRSHGLCSSSLPANQLFLLKDELP